jgi:hypothetical protein
MGGSLMERLSSSVNSIPLKCLDGIEADRSKGSPVSVLVRPISENKIALEGGRISKHSKHDDRHDGFTNDSRTLTIVHIKPDVSSAIVALKFGKDNCTS